MIPFPKIHIATSVLNRISNTLEEQGPLGVANHAIQQPKLQEAPIIPNPDVIGNALNNKIKEPAPVVAGPEGMEHETNAAMIETTALGGSPFDGALLGAIR